MGEKHTGQAETSIVDANGKDLAVGSKVRVHQIVGWSSSPNEEEVGEVILISEWDGDFDGERTIPYPPRVQVRWAEDDVDWWETSQVKPWNYWGEGEVRETEELEVVQ